MLAVVVVVEIAEAQRQGLPEQVGRGAAGMAAAVLVAHQQQELPIPEVVGVVGVITPVQTQLPDQALLAAPALLSSSTPYQAKLYLPSKALLLGNARQV
jgi:hypothetical protein